MAIVAECRACGKRFKADEKQAGKKAKCSGCGNVFVIGGNDVPAGPAAGTNPAPAPAAPARVVARPAPQIKPEPAPMPDVAPAAAKGSLLKWVITVSLVVGAGVTGALLGPGLFKKKPAVSPVASSQTTSNTTRTVAFAPTTDLPPSNPVWAVLPDSMVTPLKLEPAYRLVIPGASGVTYHAASIVMSASPGPYCGIRQTLEDGSQAVEIWNLTARSRTGMVKFKTPLHSLVLSRDGSSLVGQAYDERSKQTWIEARSTSSGQIVQRIDLPSGTPVGAQAIAGFPMQDQLAVLADRLQIYDLGSKSLPREIELPQRTPESRCAASATCKLIAVADSKALHLVDLPQGKLLGPAAIPEQVTAHPRRRLTLRAMEFSPDGKSIALVFDNQLATRRIAVFEVASGRLTQIVAPAMPVLSGGPELQWTNDAAAFLVGSGTLVDRASAKQVGQVYTDRADEGLGGALVALIGDEAALVAWEKPGGALALRSVSVQREQLRWLEVNIASTSLRLFDTLECMGRDFGNVVATQSLRQTGRLTDGSSFLAVEVAFDATLTPDAPDLMSLRADQFTLIANGQPRTPIGTLTGDGKFSLEKPGYDLRKGDKLERKRTVVFAVSGKESSLALRVGPAEVALPAMPMHSAPPTPALRPVVADKLPQGAFSDPDQTDVVGARVTTARLSSTFEYDPEAADPVPLRVSYAPPGSMLMLAVTCDLDVKGNRLISRNVRPEPPRVGLMLPNGVNLNAAAQFPGSLPVLMRPGERYTPTCLFLLDANPGQFRLTFDTHPVATVKPEPPTARSIP